MNLNYALKSTHYFKKVSYRMLRKLHQLESCRSLEKTSKIDDDYCVILYLRHMVEMIEGIYKKNSSAENIVKYLNNIISLLTEKAKGDLKIHRSLLVSCLHKHTQVFNWLRENKINIIIDSELVRLWTLRCVPAYVKQFRDKI